jgi:carboxyl-terminal processing protease
MSRVTCPQCVALIAVLAAATCPSHAASTTPTAIFEEISEAVRNNFFDARLSGLDWDAVTQKYKSRAEAARTADQFSGVVNEMLGELHSSHTHYYTAETPEYFQLCGIFWPSLADKLAPFLPNRRPDYVGIGISTALRDGKVFVSDVLAGSPAAAAAAAHRR